MVNRYFKWYKAPRARKRVLAGLGKTKGNVLEVGVVGSENKPARTPSRSVICLL